MIFGGFKSGFATATEISAFAALYALVVGSVMFRELGWRAAARSFVQSATAPAWSCSSSRPRSRSPSC
jgi:TRAP-type C4-dicarboxylate transport system permease large subunit